MGAIGPSGTPEQDAPYVHLGIRTTSDANGYLDPLAFLPARTAQPAGEAPLPTSPTPAAAPKPHTTACTGGSCAVAGSGCRECTGRGRTGRSGSRGSRRRRQTRHSPRSRPRRSRLCRREPDAEGPSGRDNRGPPAASLCYRSGHAPPGRADPQRARTRAHLESGSSRFTTGSRGHGRSHPVGAYAGGAAPCHVGLGCADDGPCACWAPAGVGGRR